MPYENLLRSTEGHLAIVTLNRPDRRNALSLDLMLELIGCLDELGADAGIREVILTAEGKAFSPGHDLSEMVGRTVNEVMTMNSLPQDAQEGISAFLEKRAE
jgi:enoyl-CoA hydratase/carnithine racemase